MAILFDTRHKLVVHIIQLVLVVAVLALSGARLLMPGSVRTRASSMGLGMGAKSLIIILYQILTEHVNRFRRWRSLKANAILNSLEVVFWSAVAFLVIQANIQVCQGTGCSLGWVVVILAIILSILSTYTAVISNLDYRFFKANGVPRGSKITSSAPEDGQSFENLPVTQK